MKILFVTYDIPYPLDAGGKIRAYHLIKQLAKKHEITLFTYYRNNEQLDYLAELKKFCANVHAFKRMRVFSAEHIVTAVTHPTLTTHIAHYYHPGLKKELEKELSTGNYQVLHLESFYTSHLLGNYPVKQVLGTENIEWQVYLKHAQQQPFYLKVPLQLETLRTKYYEQKTWQKADAIMAVSGSDANKIKKHTDKQVYIVPNGVDVNYFKFKPRKKISISPTLLFVGNFAYIQNQDAARYLIRNIFPLIKKKIPKAKLLLVGRSIPDSIASLSSNNISVRDNIEDIREAYSAADILVAPLRIGSGTQFKILEAMATGLPVVTTSTGAEGLDARHQKDLMIINSAEKIAAIATELIVESKKRHKIITNARKLIEEKYDWNLIGKEYKRMILL